MRTSLGHFWLKVVPGAFPGVPRPVTGSSPSLISSRNTVSEPVRLDFTRGIQCLSCPGASFTREIQCLRQSGAGFPRKNKCLAMARGLFPRRNVGGRPKLGGCPLEPFDFRLRGPPLKNSQNQSNEDQFGTLWAQSLARGLPRGASAGHREQLLHGACKVPQSSLGGKM